MGGIQRPTLAKLSREPLVVAEAGATMGLEFRLVDMRLLEAMGCEVRAMIEEGVADGQLRA